LDIFFFVWYECFDFLFLLQERAASASGLWASNNAWIFNTQGEGFRKQAQNLTVKSIFWRGSWAYFFPSLSVRYNARPKKLRRHTDRRRVVVIWDGIA
jgi:hypothetical protein